MSKVHDLLASKFVCARCKHQGAIVHRLQLRRFVVIHYYTFVSCTNCGYTEAYNTNMLKNKDDLEAFLDILFAG